MKFTKTLIASSILAASSLAATVQAADKSPVTANFAATSNYIWRGATQTSDEAAVSGGIDYAHSSGFYAGTWVSSLGGNSSPSTGNGSYEHDIYAGYTMDAGPVGMDFGTILYRYPVSSLIKNDFQEIYAHFTISDFGFGVDYTVDKESNVANDNDLYTWVSWSTELKKDLTLGLKIGNYDFDGTSTGDYTHYQVSLAKGDFTFALDQRDLSDADAGAAVGTGTDDLRISISWSQSFDL